ncbi:hypothetical protein E2C01_100588 [Portunus trituberculatus]|uniref:Uncharacterized protein n=1 Tax=Portunus trituberculatus TaxID=210409 RepID=A0A5B7KDY2_PORTR|nr:hypothetical protein [Portunus trituberculatus]
MAVQGHGASQGYERATSLLLRKFREASWNSLPGVHASGLPHKATWTPVESSRKGEKMKKPCKEEFTTVLHSSAI